MWSSSPPSDALLRRTMLLLTALNTMPCSMAVISVVAATMNSTELLRMSPRLIFTFSRHETRMPILGCPFRQASTPYTHNPFQTYVLNLEQQMHACIAHGLLNRHGRCTTLRCNRCSDGLYACYLWMDAKI